MSRPRRTFEIKMRMDPNQFDIKPWYLYRGHNGFTLNFGWLGVDFFVTYVERNYM